MAVSTQNTDVLTASLGRPVVLAYGKHLVGGNVILMDQSDPAKTVMFIALGEGEWDSIVDLTINDVDWDLTVPQNYQFHKGVNGQLSSTGDLTPEGQGSLYPFNLDGDQKADSMIPPGIQGVTFSRTAYLALTIPFDAFAPSATPSVIGVYQTRQVRFFNSNGVLTGTGWSDNPAWHIADILTTVRGLPDSRLDWPSFYNAAQYCAQQIDPYATGALYPRFVSNIAFTQTVSLDQALQALLSTCRGCLLDYGGLVSLRIDQPRSPVFDFTMDNIVWGTFQAYWQDTRATANRLVMTFRDTENDYQIVSQNWDHQLQQARTSRIVTAQLDLGNMPQNQAQRIGNYLLTRAIDNNLYCKLEGDKSSLAVMPGDVVRVKHDAAPWGQEPGDSLFQTFEVVQVIDNADETRDFTLQLYSDSTYSDSAYPPQSLVSTVITNRPPAPPATPNWKLSADLGGNLRLSFAIPQGADYRTGDLELLADDEIHRVQTTLAADLNDSDSTLTATYPPNPPQDGGLIIQATIANPGIGYQSGDTLGVPGGNGAGTVAVTAVDPRGVILTVAIGSTGQLYTTTNGVALTGGHGSGATVNITASPLTNDIGFNVGDYINVGVEILQITGPGVPGAPPTSATWQVQRTERMSTLNPSTAPALAGAGVYRLTNIPQIFVLPPGFSVANPTRDLSNTDQYYVVDFDPGRLRILYASLTFTGAGGASSPAELSFAYIGAFEPDVPGTLAGMRTSSGGTGTIQVPGPLATGSDLAMPLALPNGVSIGIVYAAVQLGEEPQGDDIHIQLLLNGSPIGPVGVIPAGQTGSGVFFSGAQLGGNASGGALSIDVTQVGSTTPGSDLTVYVTI